MVYLQTINKYNGEYMATAKKKTQNPALDLFNEVPVTWYEVELWVLRVAGFTPDSPRWAYYVKYWNVPDRIRAAKLAGTFDRLTME